MSGICGIIRTEDGAPLSSVLLSSMSQTLFHRGPDDEGFFVEKNVALGIRHLSIIDPDGDHQPLTNEDHSIWVAHDGKVYNFPSLRKELQARGHSFSTKTDTEVIVHGYEEWGEDFIQKLRGMFAFALWDGRQNRLLLGRDRIGIKPLYYTLLPDKTLIFGSELKAIVAHPQVKRELELQALDFYLTLEYIPSPLSIFKDIFKLQPGCLLIYKDGHVQVKKYWNLESLSSERASSLSVDSLRDKLYSLLKESIKLRLTSDVPLGAFLSGGIDSSSIVGLTKELGVSPIKTFSIGFEEASYNELKHARRIVQKFNTDHQEFILQPKTLELTEKLIRHLDEPLGDFSIFPTYLVSKMARSQIKVILSGDGGDELFGGYEHYQAQKLSQRPIASLFGRVLQPFVKKIPPAPQKKGIWNKLRRYSQGFEHNPQLRHLRWMLFLSSDDKKSLYSDDLVQDLEGIKDPHEREPIRTLFLHLQNLDEINGELFLDFKTYLPDDILFKVDRMSMATSLETRVPLLDHKLVEFAFSLPGPLKLKGLTTKWIFKKTMEQRLPRPNIYRSKEGFSIPIKQWLRRELKELMLEYLSEKRIKNEGLFRFSPIKKMLDAHLQGKENYSHQLWALVVFEIWKESYL